MCRLPRPFGASLHGPPFDFRTALKKEAKGLSHLALLQVCMDPALGYYTGSDNCNNCFHCSGSGSSTDRLQLSVPGEKGFGDGRWEE